MQRKIYKTIFFDWGGVIADDGGDNFLSELIKKYGASDDQVKEILNKYWYALVRGQLPFVEFWNILKINYRLNFNDTVSRDFKEWPGLKANSDMLNLVDTLTKKGYKTAILSNIIEPCYDMLATSGLYNHFGNGNVIASCKLGYAKPETEIYELALKMLHTTANQSIFIDDRKWNLDRAIDLGFTTILAVSSEQIISELQALL